MSKPRLIATLNRVDNLEQRPFTLRKHIRSKELQLEILPRVGLVEEMMEDEDEEEDRDKGRGEESD